MSITIRRGFLTLFLCSLFAHDATGTPRGHEELRAILPAAIEVYNELSDDPLPFLTSTQVEALQQGEVVRIRRHDPSVENRPERVTGYLLVDHPREDVWLAALDPAFRANEWLTEVRLRQDDAGRSVWYQYVDLPWPLADRHWVIDLWKAVEIATSSDGRIWEQRWNLLPDGPEVAARTVAEGRAPGLTPQKVEGAIYLPANEGAWVLFELEDDLTLIAYRVRAVVGGGIPDSWIATVALMQLEGLLRGVHRHVPEAVAGYSDGDPPVYDGFGELIAPRVETGERPR